MFKPKSQKIRFLPPIIGNFVTEQSNL